MHWAQRPEASMPLLLRAAQRRTALRRPRRLHAGLRTGQPRRGEPPAEWEAVVAESSGVRAGRGEAGHRCGRPP